LDERGYSPCPEGSLFLNVRAVTGPGRDDRTKIPD
jgi:hypothetical protein